MESRRLTAKIVSISELMTGRFVKKQGFESSYILTNLGRKLSRVRVLGLIVDKFLSSDERYSTVTLDDATETIRCKAFINVKIFDGLVLGDLVEVFGKIRLYNDEVYIIPEIVKKKDSNFETLRLLELKKIFSEQREKIKIIRGLQERISDLNELKTAIKKIIPEEDAEGIIEAQDILEVEEEEKISAATEIKNKILSLIESLNKGEGVEYQDILNKSGLRENEVDFAIQDLLESGICFEPKLGKIKKL